MKHTQENQRKTSRYVRYTNYSGTPPLVVISYKQKHARHTHIHHTHTNTHKKLAKKHQQL